MLRRKVLTTIATRNVMRSNVATAKAKANGVEPHAWLTDVLTRLPTTKHRDIDTLLPLA